MAIKINVAQLQVGHLVDLASCPFLNQHPSADFEYAQVAYVEREATGCMVVGYEGIDHVGYPVSTTLDVLQQANH